MIIISRGIYVLFRSNKECSFYSLEQIYLLFHHKWTHHYFQNQLRNGKPLSRDQIHFHILFVVSTIIASKASIFFVTQEYISRTFSIYKNLKTIVTSIFFSITSWNFFLLYFLYQLLHFYRHKAWNNCSFSNNNLQSLKQLAMRKISGGRLLRPGQPISPMTWQCSHLIFCYIKQC